ncbi:MAG: hypothetical protein CBB71_07305 [Rhodopirellula sp. TMED11]|nr:MAG: hypothetical protein CBB71_07305 [Rhodopirellula sp. TMED11]
MLQMPTKWKLLAKTLRQIANSLPRFSLVREKTMQGTASPMYPFAKLDELNQRDDLLLCFSNTWIQSPTTAVGSRYSHCIRECLKRQ